MGLPELLHYAAHVTRWAACVLHSTQPSRVGRQARVAWCHDIVSLIGIASTMIDFVHFVIVLTAALLWWGLSDGSHAHDCYTALSIAQL